MEVSMPISIPNEIKTTHDLEIQIRFGFGIFLAVISTVLTVSLFFSLAGSNLLRQIIMVFLAVGLEGAKILTFRMGKGYRIISTCLIAISILASFGSALIVVEDNKSYAIDMLQDEANDSYHNKTTIDEVSSIDSQISVLLDRVRNLPPSYITASNDLLKAIGALREQRSTLLKSLKDYTDMPIENTSMFSLFSHVSGIHEQTIILVLLMFVAIILEVSILALTRAYPTNSQQHSGEPKSRGATSSSDATKIGNNEVIATSSLNTTKAGVKTDTTHILHHTTEGITALDFLKAMKNPDTFPVLNGRDVTAKKMNLTQYHAKILVRDLIDKGLVQVEGKRLVMRSIIPQDYPEHTTNNAQAR